MGNELLKAHYFGDKEHSLEQEAHASHLLIQVDLLCHYAHLDGAYDYWIDPDTFTRISGAKGGSGDGGFRLPDSKTGAKNSSHKNAQGIDIYDPARVLAQWCVKNKHKLKECKLYMEDPRWTPVWCHFQSVPPGSHKLIYVPSTSKQLAESLEGQTPIPFVVR